MTQWEQLKTEYKEIPVPVNGPTGMLAAMEEARQKKARHKKYVQYGSLAAAAMLVFLLMPAGMFRMGSKSAAPETAGRDNGIMFDAVVEETAAEEGFWFSGTGTATGTAGAQDMNQSVKQEPAEAPMEEEVLTEEAVEEAEEAAEDEE